MVTDGENVYLKSPVVVPVTSLETPRNVPGDPPAPSDAYITALAATLVVVKFNMIELRVPG